MRLFISASWLLVVLSCLAACQSAPASDDSPSATVGTDQDANPMRALTYSRQPMADRKAAVERMLAEDAAGFWQDAAAVARQIDDWPMIRLLADKARQSKDARALPWLVRSWAMPSVTVSDAVRPERRAIEWILRQSARRTLNEIVFDHELPYDTQAEVAAWSVLSRIEPDRRLRKVLEDAPEFGASFLVSMLKGIAGSVDVLPADHVEVGQLLFLSVTYDDAQIAVWSRYRASQVGKGAPRIALRHLPAVAHRDKARDAWSWEQWLGHVKTRLEGRKYVSRGEGAGEDAVVSIRPDRLVDHAELLGVADLVVIDHLLDAIKHPLVVRDLFEQAEADRRDTTTEYGGALVWSERGKLDYRPFDPLLRRHDQAYVASTPCMHAVYAGLAHVHFHAQRYDNATWAGPGKGDLDFANAQHVNCVVLTYIDQYTLNIDAYFPGGVVIDLGCMTR